MSPGEFNDVFQFGGFRQNLKGLSLEGKQFGLSLKEVIQLGNHLPNAAAVIRAKVPRRIFNQLDLTPIDSPILRSGSVTVQPDKLDLFNSTILKLDQAF